jgi:hypothetical protein
MPSLRSSRITPFCVEYDDARLMHAPMPAGRAQLFFAKTALSRKWCGLS